MNTQLRILLLAVTVLFADARVAVRATAAADDARKPASATANARDVPPLYATQVYRVGDGVKRVNGRQHVLVAIVTDPLAIPTPTDSAGPMWLYNGRKAAERFLHPASDELPVGMAPAGAWLVWMPVPANGDIELLHGLVRPEGPLPADTRLRADLLAQGVSPILTALALLPRVDSRSMADLRSMHNSLTSPGSTGLVSIARQPVDAAGSARRLTVRLPITDAPPWNDPDRLIAHRARAVAERRAWCATRDVLQIGDTLTTGSERKVSCALRTLEVDTGGRRFMAAVPVATHYDVMFSWPDAVALGGMEVRLHTLPAGQRNLPPKELSKKAAAHTFRWTVAEIDAARPMADGD